MIIFSSEATHYNSCYWLYVRYAMKEIRFISLYLIDTSFFVNIPLIKELQVYITYLLRLSVIQIQLSIYNT